MAKAKKSNGAALREEWLQHAITAFVVEWSKVGVAVPSDVRVSCSFPGGGAANKRIGECWPRARSLGKVNEVFINPVLENALVVLDVLGHELLHAVDDCKSGHKGAFNALSKMVGYSGGKHSSAATDEAKRFLTALAGKLGPYPHSSVILTAKKTAENKGVHKFHCPEHGHILYSTAKQVDEFGAPKCNVCGEDMILQDRQKKNVKETI
jgi:hypothetical protein